jgi:transcriptional regulator of acetoin/glycerol metabolism
MLDPLDSVSRLAIIEQSWLRTMSAGLAPSADLNEIALEDFDSHGRFLKASSPVLHRMADQLAGTGFNVTLADDSARIVDIRAGSSRLRTQMESIGAALGRPFRESTSGTNAIATAYETRSPISIRGREHYVESFKKYSCVGLPIRDPITRRLAGVLNITCLQGDETQLLRPYMIESVEQIELQLLDAAGRAERHLLSAFRQWNGRSPGAAVVAFASGLMLANDLAQKSLSSEDYITLQAIGSVGLTDQEHRLRIDLRDGSRAIAEWQSAGDSDAVVFRIRIPKNGKPPADHPRRLLESNGVVGRLIVVSGERGSGKTTTVRALLGDRSRRQIHYSELSEFNWQEELAQIAKGQHALVIEELDHAEPSAISHFSAEAHRRGAEVLATTGASHEQSADLAAALSGFDIIECPPLRSRRAEFASITRSILDEIHPEGRARVQAPALAQLVSYPWPGNLVELAFVLRRALAGATDSTIREMDLPERYRHAFGRPLTLLEQAQRGLSPA